MIAVTAARSAEPGTTGRMIGPSDTSTQFRYSKQAWYYSGMLDLAKLGTHVQGLRHDRGMTLAELAAAAQVSVSMLSSVERGQKAPTIVVLSRIAGGLGIGRWPISIADSRTTRRMIVRRAADQDTVDEPGGWRRTIVSPVVPGVNFEWIRTTLPPVAATPASIPLRAGLPRVRRRRDRHPPADASATRSINLSAGDSVYFAADITHAYANAGPEPCTYYVAALIMRPRGPRVPR